MNIILNPKRVCDTALRALFWIVYGYGLFYAFWNYPAETTIAFVGLWVILWVVILYLWVTRPISFW